MNKTCRRCGTELPDVAKFCPECGEKREKLCPECGESVEGMKFCMNCGTGVEPAPGEVGVPAPQQEVTVPGTPIPQTAPCEPKKEAMPSAEKKSRKGLTVAAVAACLVLTVAAVWILRTHEDPVQTQGSPEDVSQSQQTDTDPTDSILPSSHGKDDPEDVSDPSAASDDTTGQQSLVDHMTLEQVWRTLDGVWYTGEFTRDGMMYIWVRSEGDAQILETGILSSERLRIGTVSGFKALGGNRYSVTVAFPGVEATEYLPAMDVHTATMTLDLSETEQDKLTVTGDIYAEESPAQYAYAAANLEAALYLIYG